MSIMFDPVRDLGWPTGVYVVPRDPFIICNCTGKGLDGLCDCERGCRHAETEAARHIMDNLRQWRKPRYRVKAGREVVE